MEDQPDDPGDVQPLFGRTPRSEDYGPLRSYGEVRSMIWNETVKVWKISGPAAITLMSMSGMSLVTVLFCSHLGDVALSAVTLSMNVVVTFCHGFLLGMGSALETLCGQAYGAGQLHMMGIYLQRSWIIILASCFFLLPLYIFAAPALKLVGQDERIADLAGEFTMQIIPQLFALAVNFPAQKFLLAQRKVSVLVCINVATFFVHVGLLYLFVVMLSWGTSGAALVFNITRWITALAQVMYIMGWCKETWTGFSWLAFSEMRDFVRLSFASAVMVCLETWYMMSIFIFTGHLDNAIIAVGSLSICLNLNRWQSTIFFGINAGISVRVSNELGSGHPRAAKYSVYVTVFESLLIGVLCMIIIILTKDKFAAIYTSDEQLQRAVSRMAYLLGITMLLNSVQPVISGVAIGSGWQGTVAYINLGCYYAFGLPLGLLLGYLAGYGVTGLWVGMICGTALQTLFLLLILFRTNWNLQVKQTSERMSKWSTQTVEMEQM